MSDPIVSPNESYQRMCDHNKKNSKLAYGSFAWIKCVNVYFGFIKAMRFILTYPLS